MSIELMNHVWKNAKVTGSELLVLLALADYAGEDNICWPSIATIGRKARISKRQVIRILHKLQNAGMLEVVRRGGVVGGINQPNYYRLRPDKLSLSGDDTSPAGSDTVSLGNDAVSPIGGDTVSSGSDTGVTTVVSPVSHDPSLEPPTTTTKGSGGGGGDALQAQTHLPRDADLEYGELCRRYENNFGMLTEMIGEQLQDLMADYAVDWIDDAMRVAVSQEKRKLSYVTGILKRWRAEGRNPPHTSTADAGTPALVAVPAEVMA